MDNNVLIIIFLKVIIDTTTNHYQCIKFKQLNFKAQNPKRFYLNTNNIYVFISLEKYRSCTQILFNHDQKYTTSKINKNKPMSYTL